MPAAPEQWGRVRKVFDEALDLPADRRAAYVTSACGDDPVLRDQVESLLASHDRATGILDTRAAPEAIAGSPGDLRGARLGPYLLVSRLGAGGMGVVYKARDTRLDRSVAIKILPPHVAADAQARERFQREARAVAALNHPHICTLYDVGEAPHPESTAGALMPFLVMEFVDGTTLDQLGQLPLDAARAVRLAAQVCDALDAAHAQGIVHRDIKPQNIMLTPHGHVKVLDFGVAKLQHDARDDSVAETNRVRTRTGLIMGTLPYMSPEQVCGELVTTASDVFSFGVVLYKLLTGRHPFSADEVSAPIQALVQALLVHAPASPHRHNTAVPAAVDALILAMLEKIPERRPSAAEVRRVLADPQLLARPQSTAAAVQQPRRHTVGRQRERALIDQALAEVMAGRAHMITVAGEPGIGKTTIVEEFLADVRADGRAYVARGRCSERLAGSDAYLPVLEMLENLLTGDDRHSGAQQLMAQFAPTWYAQVTPSGFSRSTGVGQQLELKTASQERMKRELRALLDELSRSKPLVLFLDDLHWSDVSTVDLLGYICSQLGSMRLLLLVTYRPTDLLLAKHPFAALKLDLSARGLCREITLGFLTRQEASAYLDLQFPGHRFPAAFASMIHDKTEGSPLFMVDLVRDLRDRQIILRSESGWALAQSVPVIERDLPASVRSMIERKIAQLADDDRQLLVAASVQGHAFDSAVVAKVLERDPADVEERLDVLDRVHAFVTMLGEETLPNGITTLRCRFVHVLYQNALYASLRGTRRAALSAAVADALIGFHGPDNPAVASEIAVLLEGARDQRRAAGYFLIASQNALRVFAFVEAAAIAERGLALLTGLPDAADGHSVELKLQVALGTARVAIKGYASPDVEQAYGRARELLRQGGDSTELASVIFGLFVYYVVVPSHQTSLELADEVLALAGREQSAAFRVQGHLMHGMTRTWMGDAAIADTHLDEGITLYDEARRAISGRTPLFDHGAGCRRYHAAALWLMGHPERAARRAAEAVRDARDLKHPLTLASALGFASMVHYFAGEVDAVETTAAEAVSCTREYVLTYWFGFASALHGWAIAQRAGTSGQVSDWELGVERIRGSLDAHRAAGARTFGSVGHALLAEAYMLRARLDEAEAALNDGIALARAAEEGIWEAELHRLHGDVAIARGAHNDAEAAFDRAIKLAHRRQQKMLELRALTSLYELARRRDDAARTQMIRARLADAYEAFTEGAGASDLRAAQAALAAPKQ